MKLQAGDSIIFMKRMSILSFSIKHSFWPDDSFFQVFTVQKWTYFYQTFVKSQENAREPEWKLTLITSFIMWIEKSIWKPNKFYFTFKTILFFKPSFFRCCMYKIGNGSCSARMTLRAGQFYLTHPHNHEADEGEVQLLLFNDRCKQRAATEFTPLRHIFSQVRLE